jgi:hypothetical protein
LLHWLDEIGLAGHIEPLYREILGTVHGQLSPRDRTEAHWCGEGAAVFGWVVQVLEAPDRTVSVDCGQLVQRLNLLRPEAAKLLAEARLQPKSEIEEYCSFCIAVRHEYQKRSVSPEIGVTLDRIHRIRMEELGLCDIDRAIEEASAFADRTTPPLQGLYVVRAIAAEWLLGVDDDLDADASGADSELESPMHEREV